MAYIVGSGQHTNSHIIETNGYLNQAPLTFYTQDGHWDLPPGFEDGNNTRFSRIIGLECMSCHNALPSFVRGSENRFTMIPNGIDCERCHGPGEVHVANIQAGKLVDTAKAIDYSIVNPRKLTWERQIDLCQRCHLQGNAILKEGKGFTDFRPGMVLSEFMDVYMPFPSLTHKPPHDVAAVGEGPSCHLRTHELLERLIVHPGRGVASSAARIVRHQRREQALGVQLRE